jgi:hypothetical protein
MLPLPVPEKLSLALVLFEVAAASVVAAVVPLGETAVDETAAA